MFVVAKMPQAFGKTTPILRFGFTAFREPLECTATRGREGQGVSGLGNDLEVEGVFRRGLGFRDDRSPPEIPKESSRHPEKVKERPP